jgi:hypothetical protein
MEPMTRVTVIQRSEHTPTAITVYRKRSKRPRVSILSRPLERAARRLIRAQVIFGQEALRRHDRANRRRRDGWLVEAPATAILSGRKAYNEELRKAVPFRLLPKL